MSDLITLRLSDLRENVSTEIFNKLLNESIIKTDNDTVWDLEPGMWVEKNKDMHYTDTWKLNIYIKDKGYYLDSCQHNGELHILYSSKKEHMEKGY